MPTTKPREEKIGITRILAIDEILRAGKYPNQTTLSKKLEVSVATVGRDLDFMRDRLNAPIEWDASRNGYYYTDNTFFIKGIMLSEGELFSLSLIQPLLDQYKNTPVEETMKNLCKKLQLLLPNEVTIDTSILSKDITLITDHLPAIDSEVFKKVFESLQTKRELSIQYRNATGNDFATTTIQPYHIICKQGSWYVLANSLKHNAIRTYALSRIKNPRITESAFSVPNDFEPKKHFDQSFGVWGIQDKPQEVRLLFKPHLANYITERTWHESQTITQNKDGSVLLSFKTNQMTLVHNWALSFGSAVKVLAPQALVEQIKAEIANMGKVY